MMKYSNVLENKNCIVLHADMNWNWIMWN